MKKKILTHVCLFLMSSLSVISFVACDKDTNCYVSITVIDEDTKAPVPNVFVKIDIDSSYICAKGNTDSKGTFDATFSAPAIFNVSATYENASMYDDVYTAEIFHCYRKGNNTIRLKEGDTVRTTVVLESTIIREYRQ